MTKEQAIEELLDLLEDHLEVADLWEIHYRAVNRGELKGDGEKKAHLRIQSAYAIPLMERCKMLGFKYSDLIGIIPTAFETTSQQREDIYHDLLVAFSPQCEIPF